MSRRCWDGTGCASSVTCGRPSLSGERHSTARRERRFTQMVVAATPAQVTDEEVEARTRAHQAKTLIVDCLGGHIVAPEPPPRDGKSYLERLMETGVDAVNITLAAHVDSFDEMLHEMYHYFNLISATPERTLLVETVADLERA